MINNSKYIITFFKEKYNLLCIDTSDYKTDKFYDVIKNYSLKEDKQTFIMITNNINHKEFIVKKTNNENTNIPNTIYKNDSYFLIYKTISFFFNNVDSIYLSFKKSIEGYDKDNEEGDNCIICYENVIKKSLTSNCCTNCSIKICINCMYQMEKIYYKNIKCVSCPVCKMFINTHGL